MFETSLRFIFFVICTPYLCQAFSSEDEEEVKPEEWNITHEMTKAGIIPKVLPHGPEQLLKVFLPHGFLDPGMMLLHEHAISVPGIVYDAPNDTWNALFIVVKENWDPEEKLASRSYNATIPPPAKNEWHQLVVLNIPGNEYMKGRTILKYDPPYHDLEKEIVDLHLYLVYRQPREFEVHRKTRMISKNDTLLASLSDYIRFYDLTGPIAANFHYRRWLHPPGFQTPVYPILEVG